MKRLISLILTLVLLLSCVLPFPASALNGSPCEPEDDVEIDIGYIYYISSDKQYAYREFGQGTYSFEDYLGDDETVTIPAEIDGKKVIAITGLDYTYYQDPDDEWFGNPPLTYGGKVKSVIVSDGIERIERDGLFGSVLESVVLPDSVTYISPGAFCNDKALTHVELGSGISNLNTISFAGCDALESITLSDSVTSISRMTDDKVSDTDSLKNIYVSDGNPNFVSIDGVVFSKDREELVFYPQSHSDTYVIPEGTKRIAPYAFYNVPMKSITIADSVTYIGEYAFAGTQISSLDIPDNVQNIGTFFIDRCYSLDEITVSPDNRYFCTIDNVLFSKDLSELVFYLLNNQNDSYTVPDGTKRIRAYAFPNNNILTSITMPQTLEVIDEYAFYNARKLRQVILNEGLKKIGSFAFGSCGALTDITMPSTLESIGYAAFYWTKLRSITLPATLKELGASAFEKTQLESVVINAPLTAIATETFSLCTQLKSITLPDTLTYVGPYAFYRAPLETVVIPDSVTEIDPSAFTSAQLSGSKGSYAQQFAGDFGFSFTVVTSGLEQKSIIEASVELLNSSYIYDGSAKRPAAKLVCDGKTLVAGTDYTISYRNNVEAGTATAVITGAGDYCDSVTLEFVICRRDAADLTYTLGSYDKVYSGEAKRPSLTIRSGSRSLVPGRDYAVSYSDNINAGTASAKINFFGNYSGSYLIPFTIEKKDISGVTLNLVGAPYTYDGVEKRPAVRLTDGSKVLAGGTDYTVSYSNHINAGTAELTVTGSGNYSVTVTRQFTIEKLSIEDAKVALESTAFYYDGKEKRPAVTVTLGGRELTNGDYTVTYMNNIDVGTAKAVMNGKGNYSGSVTAEFTIQRDIKDISSLSISVGGSTGTYSTPYTGKAITPGVTIKDGTYTLKSGTDYTAVFSDNINAGSAYVTLSGKGDYTGTAKITFKITAIGVDQITLVIDDSSCIYDGTEKRPVVTASWNGAVLKEGVDYDIASYSNNIDPGSAGISIRYKGNFNGFTSTSFKIAKATLENAVVTLSYNRYTYDGSEKTPFATLKIGSKYLSEGTDYTLSYSKNKNAGTAVVAISPKGKYTGKRIEKTFEIDPRHIVYADISISPANFTYSGTEKTPSVTLTYGEKTLVKNIDYTVSYSSNTSAGTAKVKIEGKGNFAYSTSRSFYITGLAIPSRGVTLDKSSYSYTGSAITPVVTVKVNAKTLTFNTDYTVSYSDNILIGTGTVTVTGKGNYSGTVKKSFQIESDKFVFTWGRSNWAFLNSGSSFFKKYNSAYSSNDAPVVGQRHIDLLKSSYVTKLKNNLTGSLSSKYSEYYTIFSTDIVGNNKAQYGWAMKNWGGSCYGMSALVMMAAAGLVPYSSYTSGANSIHSLDYARDNAEVASLVTYYYLLQVKMNSHKRTVKSRSNAANIKAIISNIKNYGMTMVDFRWTSRTLTDAELKDAESYLSSGHSTVGYGYVYTTGKTANGFVYDGYILLADPNNSSDTSLTRVYFNTKDNYSWEIPRYTGCRSSNGALFNVVTSDIGLINNGGYLSSRTYSFSNTADDSAADAVAVTRMDTDTLADDVVITKAYESNDEYFTAISTEDIVREVNFTLAEEEGSEGYTLRDVESSYIVTQNDPKPVTLRYDSPVGLNIVDASSVKSVVFDDSKNLVRIDGDDSDYSISMICNSNLPTDWYDVSVKGSDADRVTLRMTDEGYVISSENLSGITVTANSVDNTAQMTFSTGYDKALIYELNETTIGIRVDTDSDGIFDTDVTDNDLVSLESFEVELDNSEFTCDGNEHTPAVTVTDGSAVLAEGVDYSVKYYNNIEAGTAVVVVKGKGAYTGILSKEFYISTPKLLLGDVDGDGKVDIFDASSIQKSIAGMSGYPLFNTMDVNAAAFRIADVDGDGKVDIFDASLIQKWIAGDTTAQDYGIGRYFTS